MDAVEGPVSSEGTLGRGREAFGHQAWADAYGQLSAADQVTPLDPEDLETLAIASYLAGKDAASEETWARAHQESLRVADWRRAARCAFWLGITLLNRSERVKGGGWLARAQRVLDDSKHDCVERGYVLIPLGLRLYFEADYEGASAVFQQIGALGLAYRDTDLVTIARQAQGRVMLRQGNTAEGVALLDEAMVAVAAGEVSPIPAGIVYCSVIEACQEIRDVRRAKEWTVALSAWCASQPDLVPYRGRCLVHRSEIMQLTGAWADALHEVERACERLAEPPQPQLGSAFYQRGELQRLRGEFAKAEDAYREASFRGRLAEPGLALLRLAQGRVDTAVAAIRRVCDEAKDSVSRSQVLPAYVEITLAAGETDAAHAAAQELSTIAADSGLPMLRATADFAEGAVLLAGGDPRSALERLRSARRIWQDLEVPYEGARACVLIGLACRAIGDDDGAELETTTARRIFRQLGAAPDLARLDARSAKRAPKGAGPLTTREVQVLALVAKGRSNKEIAAELIISDRTVARHMSNIFTKLNVSSRTAATAYAFEHDLV